ncbi:putative flavoprotein monooxygenase acting on aromatic compound [Acinetobacter pittii PHEA-2]|uniref:FAD-dependent urate hydroxylase n=1 Tax=Acinetobacter pittii (strain PHEA-2) TaxID=871585 RepID=F0KHE9_ACIP2|nr:FAD-dependent urate hydroxylase HpxO [Acinetobacter pittii]YP_004997092.1 putative flavoprotein monooxygenase acting on aromatic compound [Acinetobacter pittii PHEA-2]ADY83410.1 putative flavoprotein monooxygenase acting on aromatic compound [Acinetobacter pittii PHEA-2]MBN6527677.1 FAD-dependent urate hydroxylase HpxO [Acinetobacter pittii]MBN6536464.1 FAD-dependent urate hydroxylase HpxO [Acinetobacter pittii]MEB6671261.1 FAD-dependent urate hydroxylase HpxO [Acinetobacter pittii]OCY4739
MNVVIIGAGMGGLTTGIALKKFGHQVRIFEQTEKILPVGAAISLWSNGVKCLNYLGLTDKIAKLGGQMDDLAYVDGLTGDVMTQFSLLPLIEEVGQRPYPVARADLQNMLMDEFGRDQIYLGKKMVSLEDKADVVEVHFADGSSTQADLLIGADGTHSLTRTYVLGQQVQRRYAGYVNWNGLVEISEDLAPAQQWTTYVGEGKRASLMPVADGKFYFFLDVPLPAGLDNNRDEYKKLLKQYFVDWCQPVQQLIERLDPQKTNRVEIHDIEPFTQFYKGRVVILGDAAHSTTPDIGQGGCQAMEDAIYLARSLQINTLGLEDALRRYQNKRNERANELVLRARKRCDVTHMKDEAVTQAWYEELRREQGGHIMQGIISNIVGNPLD